MEVFLEPIVLSKKKNKQTNKQKQKQNGISLLLKVFFYANDLSVMLDDFTWKKKPAIWEGKYN